MSLPIKIKKVHPFAIIPEYKTKQAAGADIYSLDTVGFGPGCNAFIRTGISVEIPDGYEIQIRSRSGLAKNGIVVANSPGTVDADFRGEIMVILRNTSDKFFSVERGDRVAQMVVAPVVQAEWIQADELNATERGAGGFGSTGVK